MSGSLWTELNTIARALGVGPPCRSKPYAFDVDHEFDLAFSELGHVNLELELQVGIIGARNSRAFWAAAMAIGPLITAPAYLPAM